MSSPCGRPSSLTPSSVTEVSLVPEPVRECPREFPRGREASKNRAVCEEGIVEVNGNDNSGGGGGGDDIGGGAAGGSTEAALGLPTTDGWCWVRFAGRVEVRLSVACLLLGDKSVSVDAA